jgi:hypothetical protein
MYFKCTEGLLESAYDGFCFSCSFASSRELVNPLLLASNADVKLDNLLFGLS